MNHEDIVKILKDKYPRDIRKQVVKTTILDEKNKVQNYSILNQIFSYVLKESNWTMPTNSQQWDSKPLDIMCDVFPKLETTKWYQEQLMMTKQGIDVVVTDETKAK
jgi:hypothetical protein